MQYPADRIDLVLADSEFGRLEMALRAPVAPLRTLVRGYCVYDEARRRITTHQHLPHRDVTFIVSLGGALEVRSPPGELHVFREGEGFLAGIHTAPAFTRSGPRQRGVEVSLTPLGAHLLLGGVPMHSVSDRTCALDALLGGAGRELAARLAESRGHDEPFGVLDTFFGERVLRGTRETDPEVREAWRLLEASHGRARIGAIASRVGWSRKRLVARFREQVGHPPKTIARVLRFDRAMDLLKSRPDARWSDVALACGYADQAHLTRDVRELSGSTPVELARSLVPESGAMTAG